jgi:hypothetical protein
VDAQASAAAQRAPATAPGADASSKPPRKSKFDLNPWAREMKRDVSYLSASSTRALISTNQTCFIFFHDLFNSFQLRNLSTTANL